MEVIIDGKKYETKKSYSAEGYFNSLTWNEKTYELKPKGNRI